MSFSQWRGEKKITIVEGLLDAQRLSANEIPAAALGGTSISESQIRQLELAGVEEVLLALDYDEAGREGTFQALSKLQDHPQLLPFVVHFDGAKDPDELIKKQGLDYLLGCLQDPYPWPSWLAHHTYNLRNIVTPSDEEQALYKAIRAYLKISGAREARLYRERLLLLAGLQDRPEELDEKIRIFQQLQQQQQIKDQAAGILSDLQQLNPGSPELLQQQLEASLQKLKAAQGIEKPAPYDIAAFESDLLSMSEGLSTGYKKFDQAAVRIPQGAITIIAGRPGHGKTTLMLNLLLNQIRLNPEKRFYFFSYEEARQWITLKLLMILAGEVLSKQGSQYAYLNYLRDKRGSNDRIEQAYEQLAGLLASQRLQIIDQSTHKLNGSELASMIAQISQEEPVGSIYVDYMQKIPVESASVRYIEIKQASELMLHEAVANNIPLIVGAQLNRDARGKPRLEQLREGGDLEQDAHLVLGLFNQALEAEIRDERAEADLSVSVLKYRSGQAGKELDLKFNRPALRITDQ